MRKIVELRIDADELELDGLGVDIMSLVNTPAIGINWQAFAQEEFVNPEPGEDKEDFISRCIPIIQEEGYPQDQASAICYASWDDRFYVDNTGMEHYKAFLDANVDMMKKPGGGAAGEGGVDHGEQMKILAENGIDTGYPFGYCFQIAQFLFYSLGGYESNWDLKLIKKMEYQVDGVDFQSTHWYVQNKTNGRIVDLSAEQFDGILDINKYYKDGRRANLGFPYYNVGDKKVEFDNTVPSLQTLKLYSKWRTEYETSDVLESFYVASKYEELRKDFASLEEQVQDYIVELAKSDEFGEEYDPESVIMIDGTKTNFNTIGDYLKGVAALDVLGRRVKKDEKPERKYRYAGALAERNFCKAMQRMRKLYTRKEIDEMSSRVNTGFRHDGQRYSIFDYKGGVNCKHYWEELDVFRSDSGQLIMISHGPASGRAGQTAGPQNNYWHHPNSRFSFNEEQRVIVGPAMVPQMLIPRKDALGNIFHVYFSKQTIKNIAEKFLADNRHNNTDVNHDDNVVTNNTLLESWIVEDETYDKSTKYGYNVPVGTWMVSYKINDEDTWQKIKDGELRGYSVAGNFIEKLAKN